MSIKTKDIVPGTVVITSKPAHPLAWPGDRLMLLDVNGSFFDGHVSLPYGVTLTITSKPKRIGGVGAKFVEVENFAGIKFTTFLSYLKPRVTIADHD